MLTWQAGKPAPRLSQQSPMGFLRYHCGKMPFFIFSSLEFFLYLSDSLMAFSTRSRFLFRGRRCRSTHVAGLGRDTWVSCDRLGKP